MFRQILLYSLLASSNFCAPNIYADDRIVIVIGYLDSVMVPISLTETFVDCANNDVCKETLDTAGAYFGLSASEITTAVAAIPRAESQGEESLITYQLPLGYLYCGSRIETISIVPDDGDRASILNASSYDRGVDVYTWTPELNFSEGRSWVEAQFTIVGIRQSLAEETYKTGACRRPNQLLVDCKGNGTSDREACGVAQDIERIMIPSPVHHLPKAPQMK